MRPALGLVVRSLFPTTVALAIAGSSGCLAAGYGETAPESVLTNAPVEVPEEKPRRIDGHELLGTYDLERGSFELERIIFLPDGNALACADRSACRPIDLAMARHPYELFALGERRLVVLRASAGDSTPFRTWELDRKDGTFSLRAQAGDAPAVLHQLACSEVMYDERTAKDACAFYRCKIESAPESDRCSYYVDFGLPYCEKFFVTEFDDPAFGPRVRQCLQEVVRDTLEHATCDVVSEAAIASHVKCYVDAGYCSLSLTDKLRIVDVLELEDWTLSNAGTLVEIERMCLER